MKLSFVQRMELAAEGFTRIWKPPTVDPVTDEVSWGEWAKVVRIGRTFMEVDDDQVA